MGEELRRDEDIRAEMMKLDIRLRGEEKPQDKLKGVKEFLRLAK